MKDNTVTHKWLSFYLISTVFVMWINIFESKYTYVSYIILFGVLFVDDMKKPYKIGHWFNVYGQIFIEK